MASPMLQEETTTICQLIPPERLSYTGLYLNFVKGRQPAVDFYPAGTLEVVAGQVGRHQYDRAALVSVLQRQNETYRASVETFDNIHRLADQRAVCVFAGQQAGLFGGPLLTIIKALAVVKAARQYSERLGRPVIPMFWIAGDDHDFEEANHTSVLNREGEIVPLTYGTPPPQPVPTGDALLSDEAELSRVKDLLKQCLGPSIHAGDLHELIDRAYTTDDTLVTAFGKLMAALTAGTGLVFFNPADAEAKQLAVPFFLQALELQDAIHERISAANERLTAAGYHIQVEKKDESTHLFLNLDGRTPIVRQADGFAVGERTFSRNELETLVTEHPEKFSPDVMLRPIMQSYLFPVVSQKGGPSEIAYFAQLNPLFDLFELPLPVQRARATLTLLEARASQHLKDMEIDFEDLFGDIEQVINRVLAKTFPDDLEADFNDLRETLERRFSRFRDEALDFDQGLKKFAEQTQGKIDYTLKNFEAKLFAAHKKKSQETRDRIYRLQNVLYPDYGLQERTLNVFSFLSRYGLGLVPYIMGSFDSEIPEHQLLCLSEYRT